MVHMGIAGQYFSELEPNFNGPPKAIDPAVRARKLVGMERRDMILTAVFGTVGALAVIVALCLAVWFYIRARKSKQRDDDLEDPNEHSTEGGGGTTGLQTQSTKKNGFLNLKTCLISTKTLGCYGNFKYDLSMLLQSCIETQRSHFSEQENRVVEE
ncbi:hypothetical protein M0804_001557 [Polistes exclamans]|nr:hypothetical protein M0804_001557 [Polistes exclamans]